MKKFFKILIPLTITLLTAVTASAYDIVNLPKTMTMSEALGIFEADDIKKATVSDAVDNTYVELTQDEIEEFYDAACDIKLTRTINATPFRSTAVNLYTDSGVSSYYLTSGVQIGKFGSVTYMCYQADTEDADALMYIDELLKDTKKRLTGESLHVRTDNDFLRLPADNWAKNTVTDAAAHCLVPYEFVGKYTNDITREEFCSLLGNAIRVAGNYTSLEAYMAANGKTYRTDYFTDCANADNSVNMLHALGIVNGKEENLFDPRGILTREEAAALVCRTAEQFKFIETDPTLIYNDKYDISPWATYFVAWVTNNFIMNGTDGSFLPKKTYTVQEAITTVNRMYKVMIR